MHIYFLVDTSEEHYRVLPAGFTSLGYAVDAVRQTFGPSITHIHIEQVPANVIHQARGVGYLPGSVAVYTGAGCVRDMQGMEHFDDETT